MRVAAEDLHFIDEIVEFGQCPDRSGIVHRGLQVQVEAVLPRTSGNGTAFDLEEVDVAPGENAESVVKTARAVREKHDERKFVGVWPSFGGGRQEEEARVVFPIVLKVFEQNFPAVDMRGAASRDCSPRGIGVADHVANASGGIVFRNPSYPRMAAEEPLALGERHRVRFNLADVVERCGREPDQTVAHGEHDFGIDVQSAFKQKIEGTVNRA